MAVTPQSMLLANTWRTSVLAGLACWLISYAAAAEDATGQSLDEATAAADVRRGRLLFLQCRACHSLSEADGHLVGPNLNALFGAVAGKKAGFVYSETAAESKVVWTSETLDRFLEQPSDFFPGTKMAFAGIPDAKDRRDLIGYLKTELTSGQ